MGLTAYILDNGLRARASIPAGCIAEMVHSEADGGLQAEIAIGYNPRVGEYIGFMCRDGRFRAFEIERTEQVDEEGIDEITATDAARTWMRHHVVESAQIAGKTAVAATESVLAGAGWEIGKATATGTVGDVPVYYETAESALAKVADTSKSEIIPYYVFVRGAVSTRKVDVLTQEPTYRGRIISPKTASQIGLIEDGLPMTRVYPVGRLDMDSEGLLLFTNDGDFAQRMMHPSHRIDKRYQVSVTGFTEKGLQRLKSPMQLDGYRLQIPDVKVLKVDGGKAWLEITIHEGRNRQVRRMCAIAGMSVHRLIRVAEGSILLGQLPLGKWRYLTREEIELLQE